MNEPKALSEDLPASSRFPDEKVAPTQPAPRRGTYAILASRASLAILLFGCGALASTFGGHALYRQAVRETRADGAIDNVNREEAVLMRAERQQTLTILAGIAGSGAIALLLLLRGAKRVARPLEVLCDRTTDAPHAATFEIPDLATRETQHLAASMREILQNAERDRRELDAEQQTKMYQTDKMANLGKMIASIAHDLNNPIACIYSNTAHLGNYLQSLLPLLRAYRSEVADPPASVRQQLAETDFDFIECDLPKLLQSVQVSAKQAKLLAGSLRNFARVEESEFRPVDLQECFDNVLLVLSSRLKRGPQVLRNYEKAPTIEAYSGLLFQVFVNLIGNAIDALEDCEKPEGEKTIEITVEQPDSEIVTIRIADNGPGIPEGDREKMFRTFFTTKPEGEGTGLGLAICRKIVVEQHGGTITCNSETDEGTEFAIALPLKQSLQQL